MKTATINTRNIVFSAFFLLLTAGFARADSRTFEEGSGFPGWNVYTNHTGIECEIRVSAQDGYYKRSDEIGFTREEMAKLIKAAKDSVSCTTYHWEPKGTFGYEEKFLRAKARVKTVIIGEDEYTHQ